MQTQFYAAVLAGLLGLHRAAVAADPPPHPLLPSVRSAEVHNPAWPSVLHDRQLTGFSPLNCGMKTAPVVWSTISLGGVASSATLVADADRPPFLLLEDSQLRRVDSGGKVVWALAGAKPCFYERLHGDDRPTLGVLQGNTLVLVDPESGQPFWSHAFEGTLGPEKVRVGVLHPDYLGQQIAVFPQYANVGYLFGFPKGQREPVEIWRTEEAGVKDWPIQADHGVMTLLEPNGAAIWNIRHHTINRHDPKTGHLLERFEFKSGGAIRRNYGPALLGASADGAPLLIATSQMVQNHLNVFTRPLDEPPTPRLDRWIGEVYEEHGVCALFPISGMGDADGDGGLDLVYSARSADPHARVKTVICDAATGRERTLDDTWLVGLADLDGDGRKELFAYEDPEARMPAWGTLRVYRFELSGELKLLGSYPQTELMLRPVSGLEQPSWAAWCCTRMETPAELPLGKKQQAVFLRDRHTKSTQQLTLRAGALVTEPAPPQLADAELLALRGADADTPATLLLQLPEGRAAAVDLDGQVLYGLPLGGGPAPEVTAADLSGDGRPELAIRTPTGALQIVSFSSDGKPQLDWNVALGAPSHWQQPGHPLADVNGDGHCDVVAYGATPDGNLTVRLLSGQGETIWETPLPMAASGTITHALTGDFFGPGHAGVFVSAEQGLARENSFMLDGPSGRIVWSGQDQPVSGGVRACNPVGLPTAVDIDGDGADDVVLDYRDYGAIHRGSDGRFLLPLTRMPSVPKGWCMAYNSFIPVYRPTDGALHFLIPSGHGGIGLLGADMTTEVWTHKPYYDTPIRMAMIDVDGDGQMEVGYEESRDGWFVCRELWSGKERWRLKLDGHGYGPAISADFDGDGRGEFFLSGLCIGQNAEGKGEIRWRAPASVASWPLVADLDGDGRGELIFPSANGTVCVLKAAPER